MADPIRFPISNAVTGNTFTLALAVGSQAVPMNVLLDTGSSMASVYGDPYDPGSDTMATTTRLLQGGSFREGGSFAAAIVRTLVALPAEPQAASTRQANVGVVHNNVVPSPFGKADGILGLAYPALNAAVTMPNDTWANRYTPAQLGQGQPAGNLPTCLDQLVAAWGVSDTFAFAVRRTFASQAADSAAADRLNAGVFVLGGGEECAELYTGDFVSVGVVHEAYYNTNLIAVQVGDRTIPVAPTPAGDVAGSNSFIDSGNAGLGLDPGLYEQVIGLFNAVDPTFGPALGAVIRDQAQLDLAAWPALRFVLQGTGGAPVTLTVEPRDYWQFDGYGAGTARAVLSAGGAPYPGQSILGLPLLAGRYVVFDRSLGPGHGVIKFAAQRDPDAAPLVA